MHRCKRSRDQRAGKTAYLPNLQCRQPRCRGFPIRFRLHIPDLARRLRARRGGNRAHLWQGRGQSPRHGAQIGNCGLDAAPAEQDGRNVEGLVWVRPAS
jgi:hypothetical protein